VPDLTDLNIRQAAFVREYLLTGNATEAYVKAGFSPNGAEVSASRLLGVQSRHLVDRVEDESIRL